ncbi:SusC/RagA family TonB-linked outer membrane protein [Aquimarina agarilytica]|uniref:SusC/RagA family TonB-linked outer membrane protein n=1 Tax=Aquimarina agarilytica TaxID=1087449 RepID=UPI0002889C9F|nr:TonB-dependent receptor [Aquimarina agarilytica]
MKKHCFFLIIALGSIYSAFAQITVRGTVKSADDNTPIPSAAIYSKGQPDIGVASDFDGNFSIELNEKNGILVVSSLGFKTKEVSYTGNQVLEINLNTDLSALEEVVLIGYGTAKKGDLTSAIAPVENIATLVSRPVTNFTDFLQGNTPGVTVLQNGGDPTSPAKVVIRGLSSVNSSSESVLTIVDGVPYYGPAINPNDIASASVLKDAASTAIYGALGSGGVILIETKKGKKGKPRVAIDTYTGYKNAINLPTALTAEQQAAVYNLAAGNGGDPLQSAHDPEQNPWGQVTRTDWIKEIFRNAPTTNVNASVSGAGEYSNYFTSFSYNNTEGVLQGTGFERYTFRVKSDFDITNKLTIGENVYFSQSNAVGADTSSGYSGTIINGIYMPSAAPTRDENGDFHGVVPFNLSQFAGAYGDVFNPLALLLAPTDNRPSTYLNAGAFLNYEILEGLNFRTNFSYAFTNNRTKRFVLIRRELGRTNLVNSLTQTNAVDDTWVWDNQIAYVKSFGNHNLNATAIHSAQNVSFESLSQRGEGFSSEAPFNQFLGNATVIRNPSSRVYQRRLRSIITRLMYNYDNRYYVSGSYRQDESSRLSVKNQKDDFFSGTVAWKISNESFFNTNFINDLKIRASYGEKGNINSVSSYSFDVPLGSDDEVIGANGGFGNRSIFELSESNPNLTWERSKSINVGLDTAILNNSLSFTADYFEKRTVDMLFPGDPDATKGIGPSLVNAGEVLNRGVELSATYKNTIGDLGFKINANIFSLLQNELVSLAGDTEVFDVPQTDDTSVRQVLRPFRSKIGEELFSYFLVPYEGIFQNQAEIDAHSLDGNLIQPNAVPGDFKFTDTNGDGKISPDDRQYLGSYQPDFTYSFGVNLDYKGFDLNMLFQGVSGSKVFNGYKYATYNASLQGYNLDNRVLNAWTSENTNTDIPRISTKDNNSNFGTNSSWYLEDASYLRLKNITLGYSIPEQAMSSVFKGASLRLFVSAENVFTITDYSGIDPEVGGFGLDVARFPLSRTITTGLSLSF